jgi:hypothetical protein
MRRNVCALYFMSIMRIQAVFIFYCEPSLPLFNLFLPPGKICNFFWNKYCRETVTLYIVKVK